MSSKRRLEQLKSVRVVAIQALKKRKSEPSLVLNTQPEILDDKLITADTSDTPGEAGIWFWNDCANENGSDTEVGEEDDGNESDLEVGKSRAVSPEAPKKDIK